MESGEQAPPTTRSGASKSEQERKDGRDVRVMSKITLQSVRRRCQADIWPKRHPRKRALTTCDQERNAANFRDSASDPERVQPEIVSLKDNRRRCRRLVRCPSDAPQLSGSLGHSKARRADARRWPAQRHRSQSHDQSDRASGDHARMVRLNSAPAHFRVHKRPQKHVRGTPNPSPDEADISKPPASSNVGWPHDSDASTG